jgi:hypothetical protein
MSIGERLRTFAETGFRTITEFAYAIGSSPQNVYKYFKTDREPSAVVMKRLVEAGCNLNWLVAGDGDMFADNSAGDALRAKIGNIADPPGPYKPPAARTKYEQEVTVRIVMEKGNITDVKMVKRRDGPDVGGG